MIPKNQYKKIGMLTGVTYDQVRNYHGLVLYDKFWKFMCGQTCGYDPITDTVIIYSWDYERWINEGMKDKQGINWD